MHPNNNNYSSEVPAHIAAKGVPPMPGAKNEVGAEHERLAANVRGPHATAPTGYINDGVFNPSTDVFGSGSEWYGDHWDKGFAGEGDPYGIHSEYVAQSASPNAALPTQADGGYYIAENATGTFDLTFDGKPIGTFVDRVSAEKAEALAKAV